MPIEVIIPNGFCPSYIVNTNECKVLNIALRVVDVPRLTVSAIVSISKSSSANTSKAAANAVLSMV